MGKLLALTAKYRKNYVILVVTALAMLMSTVASQLEILSIGVISNQSVDAFALFSPTDKPLEVLNQTDVQQGWEYLDPEQKGYVTKQAAISYIAQKDETRLFVRVMAKLSQYGDFFNSPIRLALYFFIVAIIKAASTFLQGYTTSLVSIRVAQRLRQDYFDHIQDLSLSFYQRYNVGSLAVRVSGDAEAVALAINSLLTNYLQTPFTLLSSLVLLYYISARLFVVVFLVIPLLIIPIWILTKKVKEITRATQTRQEQITNVLYEFLAGIQTIKSFAMEELSSKKYDQCNKNVVKLEEKGSRYSHALRPILHFFGSFFLVILILWGFYIANLTLSELLVFCGLLSQMYEPIKKFADENLVIQKGVVSAERINEVMLIQPEFKDLTDALILPPFQNAITFENVSFKYSQEDPDWVLKDFNLTINKGEFLAIVGPTGVGKSTLVQLMLRLYDVDQGKILIDGTDIRMLQQKSLRQGIGYVPQRPFLFLDTIESNIAFGEEESEEKVKNAAQMAHADHFIEKMPNGYKTILSETGKNLSGGQQQRLALARALYKNAQILVLDEATSSLDVVTEEKIKDALKGLSGQKTLIVIAHRLSTVASADRILYLDQDTAITGTLDELLKQSTHFAALWKHQLRS